MSTIHSFHKRAHTQANTATAAKQTTPSSNIAIHMVRSFPVGTGAR